ncbi:hypothetical protein GKZ89_13000 [Bacillus mangrovi]|uniref:Uncharacterized protein n=1 Tax=Metabacillus mangrovi TaxID=1491830 RepID=A0A7X2S6I8_9BACI|nr:hypothetical protein [Metabacillus mangrovi]
MQHRTKSSCVKNHLKPMISVDPLASLDIFGQQRISTQEPHLTKNLFSFHIEITEKLKFCQRNKNDSAGMISICLYPILAQPILKGSDLLEY